MRIWRIILALLWLPGLAPAGERVPAEVTFSDGSALAGTVEVIGSRPLTISPTDAKRQQTFHLKDLRWIRHETETATLERPWTFAESGRHDKIYLDAPPYPLLNFRTTLGLVNGEEVAGHLISLAFRVRHEEGRDKFFLKRQIRGQGGQQLGEIVYPTLIRFPEHLPAEAKTLGGTITGAGRLIEVRAHDIERRQVVVARVQGDRFEFGKLLPGRYDLAALTSDYVLCGFSQATPSAKPAERPLPDNARAGIEEAFPKADDFFNDRWVLALRGHQDYAKTLVYKRRAKYYASEKHTPGGYLWHLEVWSWHSPETEWKLDQRFILVRRRQTGQEATRKLVLLDELTGVEPGAAINVERPADAAQWPTVRELD